MTPAYPLGLSWGIAHHSHGRGAAQPVPAPHLFAMFANEWENQSEHNLGQSDKYCSRHDNLVVEGSSNETTTNPTQANEA